MEKGEARDRCAVIENHSLLDAARWRDSGPPLFNELIGHGQWRMDETDYGFTIGVGFRRSDGKMVGVYLARVLLEERDGRDAGFCLTEEEGRAALLKALA